MSVIGKPVLIRPVGSASGAVATFPDGDGSPLRALIVGISPSQSGSGTPSYPDNIRPIYGWTGAQIVVSPTAQAADGTTYTVSWQTEAGTVYGGTLNVLTGVLTVRYAAVTFDGSQSLSKSGTTYFWFNSNIKTGDHSNDPLVISSYLPNTSGAIPRFRQSGTGAANTRNIFFYNMSALDPSITSAAALQTFFSEHPLTVVYELYEPVEYQLSPQQIDSLKGINTIYADTGDVSVEYNKQSMLFLS